MSRGSGICWEIMNNLIFRRHFLTEVTGSAWLLPKPVLLVLVSTVFEASWLFSAIDTEARVGGISGLRPVLMCQMMWVPYLGRFWFSDQALQGM